jgi:hypothetical protein
MRRSAIAKSAASVKQGHAIGCGIYLTACTYGCSTVSKACKLVLSSATIITIPMPRELAAAEMAPRLLSIEMVIGSSNE